MRENRMEIANSNDVDEINMDWEYLKDNVVPQIDQKIDIGKMVMDTDLASFVELLLKRFI
ncbi:hypothetical protein MHM84_20130 [Halomonas sp. McH1-25]|uniref:hypothetical protein n=1 Tax=unclassified Halomonas TaxID=2609666 RepID=UPI001EF42DD2|nr:MULTISPECIES: hypothetical protein [unclassified Halomonas]MCG7602054.1 hypothetical protein [Halomonas sp. McH1-25]MCP1342890.1 hypothetical protein [Halomonas sp. FL8]MCP1361671.1 hypothetical protein [Halomonas sp. BBD45]MCP1363632.1 hypothetical protein [Halomonas sp. BBD48]